MQNRTKSALPSKISLFSTSQKSFKSQQGILNEITQQECPIYMKYKSKKNESPLMKLKDFKIKQQDPNNHKDYLRFKKMKNNFIQEYKGKLDEYLIHNTKYERRFFKIYKREDQIYFKHKNKVDNISQPEVTDMPDFNRIISVNQQLTSREIHNKIMEKRKKELKQEEKEEKEYMKSLLEKFLNEEQKYFNTLQVLKEEASSKFQEKIELLNKYTHDYVDKPNREYVEKKDLYIGQTIQIPEIPNSSLMSMAGSQHQLLSQQQLLQINNMNNMFSPFSSSQLLPQMPQIQRQNTLLSLPVPQIQEQELKISEQIKQPSTYQTNIILELFRLITLNQKIEITFRIISNINLLHLEDTNGQTLLHQAAHFKRNGIAKFLLIKGINYEKKDHKDRTALQIAEKMKNNKLIQYIHQIKKKGSLE